MFKGKKTKALWYSISSNQNAKHWIRHKIKSHKSLESAFFIWEITIKQQ